MGSSTNAQDPSPDAGNGTDTGAPNATILCAQPDPLEITLPVIEEAMNKLHAIPDYCQKQKETHDWEVQFGDNCTKIAKERELTLIPRWQMSHYLQWTQ